MIEELLPFCECGKCGLRVTKKGNKYIHGHHRRGKSHTPEACAAMSDAHTDVPRTTETCTAISKGCKNSKAVKANIDAQRGVPRPPEHIAAAIRGQEESGANEAMRGGDDLVTHHYIYDHDDLSLNTAQMNRSDHTSLHNILRGLGYKVPHINVKEE